MGNGPNPLNLLRRHVDDMRLPPYVELGRWPTPVQRLERFGRFVGADVWVKRDDLTALPYGGNKVRKLEFLLGEALRGRCHNIVSVGGIGSNHLIATAVHARKMSMGLHAVVFPQPITAKVRQGLGLLCDLGVRFHPVRIRPQVPLAVAQARREAPSPMYVPPGGSSPAGVLGYVCAGLELAHQISRGQVPEPDVIYAPLGTGGTVCGLMLGLKLAGLRSRLRCVRVVEALYANEMLVRVLLRRTLGMLARMGASVHPGWALSMPVHIVHDQMGRAYGQPTVQAVEAVRRIHDLEGLKLETTYTGKALASLVAHAGREFSGRRVLFFDTFNSHDLDNIGRDLLTRELPPPLDHWIRTEPVQDV